MDAKRFTLYTLLTLYSNYKHQKHYLPPLQSAPRLSTASSASKAVKLHRPVLPTIHRLHRIRAKLRRHTSHTFCLQFRRHNPTFHPIYQRSKGTGRVSARAWRISIAVRETGSFEQAVEVVDIGVEGRDGIVVMAAVFIRYDLVGLCVL